MKLLTPIQVGPVELKNRVVMPAMHLGYTPDGKVSERLVAFYRARAEGGAGLIVVGGCPIDEYSGMPGMVSIRSDDDVPGLTWLADEVHQAGGKLAAQLYQPGRYAFSDFIGGRQALAPSAVRSKFTGEIPQEMTKDDIKRVVKDFAAAARRAREATFDAVEILASAGYLISQFLSPLTNQRTDEYNGDFRDRMRFGLEVAAAVREAAGPDMAVMARLAGHDFMPGSHTNEQSARFAEALALEGVDLFDVTGGWHETRVPQIPMNLPRGGYVFLAEGIKQAVNKPVIACNRINNPQLAEEILKQGRADLIGAARGFLAEPDWVKKTEDGRADQINTCIACNQGCFDHVFTLQPVCCMVNPMAGFESELSVSPAADKKRILVVGGGPAGLSFAKTAALRGHDVTLYEKQDQLGGQIRLAASLPERAEFMTMIHSFESQARERGVRIELGHSATPEMIEAEKPDLVVVAAGGRPMPAPFPGGEMDHVMQAWDVLAGRLDMGERVVVIGGGAVGCEAALKAARIGALTPDELHFLFVNQAETPDTLYELTVKGRKHVVLVEMTSRIGSDIGQTTGWIVRQDLRRAGVEIKTKARALEITDEGVLVEMNDQHKTLPADTVILALGTESKVSLYQSLKERLDNVLAVGDAAQAGKAYDAVHQAFRAALEV
jgi:2,4-dienoyl-CoA reductase (NADPH2)